MRRTSTFRQASWLAIVLVMWSVCAPLLVHAVLAWRDGPMGQQRLCSSTVVSVPGQGVPSDHGTQADHCTYCFLDAPLATVPALPWAFDVGLARYYLPRHVLSAAGWPAPLYSSPYSRAPPVLNRNAL